MLKWNFKKTQKGDFTNYLFSYQKDIVLKIHVDDNFVYLHITNILEKKHANLDEMLSNPEISKCIGSDDLKNFYDYGEFRNLILFINLKM